MLGVSRHAAEGIITPEAVVLELSAAGVGTRVLAKLIDLVIQAGLVIGLVWVLGLFSRVGAIGQSGVFMEIGLVVGLFTIVCVLPAVSETLWDGRTPGKAVLGIRVVTLDGSPISARHAMPRAIVALIDVYIPLGLFLALFDPLSRRFGDLVAGTFVLSERAAAARSVPFVFAPPFGLEEYVATLDVGAMTEAQYVLMRTLLIRVTDLSPEARHHLTSKMSAEVEQLIGRPRPPWLSPEFYLVCVASARQLRSGTASDAAARHGQWAWSAARSVA